MAVDAKELAPEGKRCLT